MLKAHDIKYWYYEDVYKSVEKQFGIDIAIDFDMYLFDELTPNGSSIVELVFPEDISQLLDCGYSEDRCEEMFKAIKYVKCITSGKDSIHLYFTTESTSTW